MAESEERPSKIRKIDSSEKSFKESLQAQISSGSLEQTEAGHTNISEAEQIDAEPKKILSKSQQKKLLKTQRWEAGKDYRREKRREKHKQKQARKAEKRANRELPQAANPEDIETEKKIRTRKAVQTPVALILDCDFDQYMTEKEIMSLGAQVTRCYSENKKSPYRSHLAISSWGGRLKQRFDTVLTRNHESWKGVTFHEDDFMAAAEKLNVILQGASGGRIVGALAGTDFKLKEVGNNESPSSTVRDNKKPDEATVEAIENSAIVEPATALETGVMSPTEESSKKRSQSEAEHTTEIEIALGAETAPIAELKPSSIIYLSSDSPNTLTDLEPNTSYIIGGIVDKNRHKGLCYKRACERGIRTAKLPIGDYMTIQGRSVLAINHVVEIMLKWLEAGDWGEAFMSVIPKRKEAKLKVKKGDQQDLYEESPDDDEVDSRIDYDEDNKGNSEIAAGNQTAGSLDGERTPSSPPFDRLEPDVRLENAAVSDILHGSMTVEQESRGDPAQQ